MNIRFSHGFILFLGLLLSGVSSHSVARLLSHTEAFELQAQAVDAQTLQLTWKIADGYWLIRDKITVSAKTDGVDLGAWSLPPATGTWTAGGLGDIEIYRDLVQLTVPVRLQPSTENAITLLVTAQGCPPEPDPCYPSFQRTVTAVLPAVADISSDPSSVAPAKSDDFSSLKVALRQQTETAPLLHQADDDFLPPEQAFAFSTLAPYRDRIIVQWQIAPGYYLYQDKFKFTVTPGQLGAVQYPPAKTKDDPLFGRVAVYDEAILEIELPLQPSDETQQVHLTVQYQGCAEAGLCYPPIDLEETLTLPAVFSSTPSPVVSPVETSPVVSPSEKRTEQDQIADLLKDGSMWYVLLMFFGFGLLLAFTPCVFPMIPILSSIIAGQDNLTTRSAFTMSLVYVLAMALTYALAGVFAGILGESLQTALQTPVVTVAFALVFVALALSMFGFYDLQLPNSWQTRLSQWSNSQQGGTLAGVAIMGILSALIVGPCVAAPLAGALIYIGQTQDAVLGGFALFSMGLGMGAPLLLIGTSAGRLLPKAGLWMNQVKAVFGVLLLAVAIWLSSWLLSPTVESLLWAVLLIVSAVFMGALEPVDAGATWRKMWKGLGIILLLYGAMLLIGVAAGSRSVWQPLSVFTASVSSNSSVGTGNALTFQMIKGNDGLDSALANAQGRPVMLDFYADWCVSCKEMEHFTFTDSRVQAALADFVRLQTDVTANDAADKALYQRFGLFGPPAILFFDARGEEQRGYRVVGFMTADKFYQHITELKQP
ncbi:protein-disulfide reductase DsbD [Thioflexithrix psekupsensis]|uniref:Thiol:disulfide interchange protein DsbD n=1 Tax=Thioflexithrix psekupsensis TaxID=1570016 RepID=A0A251X646_9GAMM|nr:protein-disulfide reductase DsbD [Thioflexithrix psekupsensis]OUD13067.1 hypothetical protein TPSD3_10475 [Thioflexithrix psekupsensis]